MAKVNAGDDNEDRKRLKEKLKVALRSRAMQSRSSRLAHLAVHTGTGSRGSACEDRKRLKEKLKVAW